MMEYKVCFHMSYPWGYRLNAGGKLEKPRKYHGKLHFCGDTLEEAVSKVRDTVARNEVNEQGTCTSMWIMRGREKGKNIRWTDYHKRGEARKRWIQSLTDAVRFRDEAARERRRRNNERGGILGAIERGEIVY